jgi:fructose-1,6-bisphosphatase/inositol monophosphatase family enzyme
MTPDQILELFDDTAAAVRNAVAAIDPAVLRDRTDRKGQYALDLVADEAACRVLEKAPVRIVSEESGVHPRTGEVTVVLDPVDGSTNCARGIAYWATSLCALDADGPVAALVVNQATGQHNRAVRGQGATRDGVPLRASKVKQVEESVVYLTGTPPKPLPWKQWRSLGSAALGLCEIAAGSIDGFVDAHSFHAPWDYLGGLLACTEAGATVLDARGRPLVTADPEARRKVMAAGTPELAALLMRAAL